MTRLQAVGAGALVLALGAAGCGGGGGSGNSSSSGDAQAKNTSGAAATVGLRAVPTLGKVLVDGSGRTLYLFEKDTGRASTCFGACASAWPPLTASGKPSAGAGVKASLLGTTKRKDGKTEVTYAGHPLYRYAGDAAPGDAKGENLDQFGAEWYVLSAQGTKVEPKKGGSKPKKAPTKPGYSY